MNNTTSAYVPSCDRWYLSIGRALEFPIYYVLCSIFSILGLATHFVCLLAFYKRSKKEQAYLYQIMITGLETFGLLAGIGYYCVMVFYWGYTYYPWFNANYALMWYSAHLAVPLLNMPQTTCLILATSMAIDRLWAVWRPVSYKNISHKRHQIVAFILSLLLGVTASLFDCFRYTDPVKGKDGLYRSSLNKAFVGSPLSNVASWYRNMLRICMVVAIVVVNSVVTRLYLKRVKEVATLTFHSAQAKQEKRALRAEITLALLTAFQCLFISIATAASIAYYAATYAKSSFDSCEANLWAPLLDLTMLVAKTADLFVVIIVSKQFRKMIADLFRCS